MRFVVDPGVGAADRAVVRRGARLGRRAFQIRNTLCEPDDVKVFVRAGAGPRPSRITASSGRGEVWVYTESEGWEEASVGARLVTLLHEMYHVLQFYRTGIDHQVPPQWLVEGSAEWAAGRVAVDIGLYPTPEAAIGRPSLDADPSELRRAATPEGWSALNAPYALAFRATEVLLDGAGGMKALDDYWRLLEDLNDGWILTYLVEWKPAFRQAFGMPVSRFYRRFERALGQ